MIQKSFQILFIIVISGISIRFFQKLIQGKNYLRDVPSVKKRVRKKAPRAQRLVVSTVVYTCIFMIWAWLLFRALTLL